MLDYMDTGQGINSITDALAALFPDERVTCDLNEQLFSELGSGESVSIELDGLGRFEIPPNCQHRVCSVVLQRDLVPMSGEVRVLCAVGGVKQESNGIIHPKYCFAVVRYNQDGELFNYDLHASQFY
jgi:hypothetical protein